MENGVEGGGGGPVDGLGGDPAEGVASDRTAASVRRMRAAGRSPEFIAAAIVVDAGTIDGCKSADRIGVFAPGSDDAARRWTRVEFRGARAEIEAAEEARR